MGARRGGELTSLVTPNLALTDDAWCFEGEASGAACSSNMQLMYDPSGLVTPVTPSSAQQPGLPLAVRGFFETVAPLADGTFERTAAAHSSCGMSPRYVSLALAPAPSP